VLQHVSLEVRPDQVRDCVAFWELLGFREIEPPPTLRRFTWVEREGTHIHLVPVDDPAVPVHGHAAVVAPDDEAIARLEEHGFEPREGGNAWGAPRWFVLDPAGHGVEVMSAAPPS
jgi:catechol 2,3-dioxygenase-like lactoylglutathione lyase family enzyme